MAIQQHKGKNNKKVIKVVINNIDTFNKLFSKEFTINVQPTQKDPQEEVKEETIEIVKFQFSTNQKSKLTPEEKMDEKQKMIQVFNISLFIKKESIKNMFSY